ncbi:unnamed protein product [Rotaria sp. Silwood2]|nr:unnamed protein product [Rotaria sp. Silwood2]CAF2775152.1 unnamed protein product [Rotaria sp. Silwood2]CAF2950229.1 unnamed protein product [Rotaria sp. Silwood2]CAF4258146.1 unnamed protein product [Rotaria sp. Silwood2]CAF4379165.1 unnamed protein product [Rotaria sp. Silwood2]
MVRYVTMKRITQILASIVFVITVVTVYFAFDFAINTAISNKASSHKRSRHEHGHHGGDNHPHDDIRMTKKRSIVPSTLSHAKKSNRTIKHHNDDDSQNFNNERRGRTAKEKTISPVLGAKPGHFHKGKTGVKVNKPRKIIGEKRKRLTTTTTVAVRNKDIHNPDRKVHV